MNLYGNVIEALERSISGPYEIPRVLDEEIDRQSGLREHAAVLADALVLSCINNRVDATIHLLEVRKADPNAVSRTIEQYWGIPPLQTGAQSIKLKHRGCA